MPEPQIRVFFPSLKLKRTYRNLWRRPKQPLVVVRMNGRPAFIPRGVIAVVPAWVREVCDHTPIEGYECFASNKAAN